MKATVLDSETAARFSTAAALDTRRQGSLPFPLGQHTSTCDTHPAWAVPVYVPVTSWRVLIAIAEHCTPRAGCATSWERQVMCPAQGRLTRRFIWTSELSQRFAMKFSVLSNLPVLDFFPWSIGLRVRCRGPKGIAATIDWRSNSLAAEEGPPRAEPDQAPALDDAHPGGGASLDVDRSVQRVGSGIASISRQTSGTKPAASAPPGAATRDTLHCVEQDLPDVARMTF